MSWGIGRWGWGAIGGWAATYYPGDRRPNYDPSMFSVAEHRQRIGNRHDRRRFERRLVETLCVAQDAFLDGRRLLGIEVLCSALPLEVALAASRYYDERELPAPNE